MHTLCTQAYRYRDTLLLAGDTDYLLFTTKFDDTLWLCHDDKLRFYRVFRIFAASKNVRTSALEQAAWNKPTFIRLKTAARAKHVFSEV